MVTYFLLCRKAQESNCIESSANIYMIEGKPYIGYNLTRKQEIIFEALKKANLTKFRIVELGFPDPKDLSSRANFQFVKWVAIFD